MGQITLDNGKIDSAILIRSMSGQTFDVRVDRPANSKAIVHSVGEGLNQASYTFAGQFEEFSNCSVYGQKGSGSGGLTGMTLTMDSGTPYAVSTITVVW